METVDQTHAVASVLFASAIVRDAERVRFREARVVHDLANEARVTSDAREPGFRWATHRLLLACLRILDAAVPVPYPPIPPRPVRYEDLEVFDLRRRVPLDGRARELSHDQKEYVDYLQERALEFLGVLHADQPVHAAELDAHWTRRVVPASAAFDAVGGPKLVVAGPRRSRSVFVSLAGAECVPAALGMLAEALGTMTSAPRDWVMDFVTSRLKWTVETCVECPRCSFDGSECTEMPKVPLRVRLPGIEDVAPGACGPGTTGVRTCALRIAGQAASRAAWEAGRAVRAAKRMRAGSPGDRPVPRALVADRVAQLARAQAGRAAAALRELRVGDVTNDEAEMLAASAHDAWIAVRRAARGV